MVKRRAKKADNIATIGNHCFRGTGITNYLENGGRRKITRGEVERITILG
ncbi:MAG: hypothetical protein H0T51_13180 [Pirellulales bacterium]|nr:hypothetical protein [Pirellulales bacterium]